MIKINLLPDCIFEPARKKAALAVSLLVIVGLSVGMFIWGSGLSSLKVSKTEERDQQKLEAQKVDAVEAQTQQVNDSFAELKSKVQAVRDIYCHNLVYVKLYKTLADWTPNSYRYDRMAASGSTAHLNVYTRKLDDVAYYLLSMQRCPAISPAGISIESMYSKVSAGGSGGAAQTGGMAGPAGMMGGGMTAPTSGGVLSPTGPMPMMGGTMPSANTASASGSGLTGYTFPVAITLKSAIPGAPAGFGGAAPASSGGMAPMMGGGMPAPGGIPSPTGGSMTAPTGGGMTAPGGGGSGVMIPKH